MPIPRELHIEEKIFLCTSCDRYLRQKNEMPPLCYFNGLEVDQIPKELELNDLEATLVSKRLLFLKIYHLPKSRWSAVKDKTVNVPICDNTLLKTLNQLVPLPRHPGEAGLICVTLKRKLTYKNMHVKAYIQPEKLVEAVKKLKELGHPGYDNIEVNERFSILEEEDADDEENDQTSMNQDDHDNIEQMDSIQRNQFDLGGSTTMTESYPETSVVQKGADVNKNQSQVNVSIAPGEGQIPTDLMRDDYFDIEGFPHLHPTGKFGLNHPREKKLTKQQYFLQRLQNIDKRWSQNSAYLFTALYCIERESLERQINISYRKGKMIDGTLYQLEDAFSVFNNVPGTVRYWQQKRFEVLAKLEQLGPFQFFFTLSCADKRWDENFVSILRQKGLKIIYKNRTPDPRLKDAEYSYQADEIWIKQEGKEEVTLKEYLANDNLHDLVRKNVLNITMNFDKRVHAFINKIIMAESSPMHTKFYHYRVEFQMRGAGHIHGVLWVDLPKLEENFPGLLNVMSKLKTSCTLNSEEKDVAAKFVDAFVTCSLDIDAITDIVKEVQEHSHTQTCLKRTKACRFGYPKFPSNRTLIAQPLNKDNFISKEAYDEEKKG